MPLSELCEFQNGFAFKNSDYIEKSEGTFEIFRMGNIHKGGGFNPDANKAFVPQAQAVQLRRFILKEGDILMCMTDMKANTALLGHTAWMPVSGRYLLNQRVGRITVKRPELLDRRFLYYYSNSPEYIQYLRSHANSGVQVNLSTDAILNSPIKCPSLSVQRQIAGILSAYDELIENNQRRIKILEEMARSLYREWFVHFRFPGHDKVKMVPSPLGRIPQGWEVTPLFELTKVNYGKNLPTKKLADDGPYPVYGAAKIIGLYTEYSREGRTIICGCRGSVGEMQITEPQCYVTNNSFTFDPTHSDNFFWLFHALKERGLRDVIGGAAQPQITLEGISSVELVTPPLPLRTRFQQTVAAIFELAWVLNNQIKNLRHTRDLVLPRLLAGQIDLANGDL